MKTRSIWLWVLLLVTAISGCKYDDADLWNKVNSLDDRVTSLEGTVESLNQQTTSLQTLINGVQNRLYISSVTSNENGYTIEFSDGTVAAITNGTNGADGADAPVISIKKDTDGKYYWIQTIDGTEEWLVDDAGNKLPVSGEDAITPQLKVNANGFWLVSYDNGATFTEILDEAGNPVKAVGEDGEDGIDGSDGTPGASGDSFFSSVTVENGYLVLVLAATGEEISIPFDNNAAIGIPDSQAGTTPTIQGEPNLTIPQPAFYVDENNEDILNMSLTGIQIPETGEWMELFGTGDNRQNIWVEVDGKPKAIKIINSETVQSRTRGAMSRIAPLSRAKADVVFLVDNSGSMSEEANTVAQEIIDWSTTLSQTMDVQFGCVGIDHNYVNGAIDITTVEALHDYLNNRSGHTYGIYRTTGYVDANLETKAAAYNNAGGECGGIMLHFADENFTFRSGANRIYVHFTDEPNQPNNHVEWSVESVNTASPDYNWGATRGTIHTVFSDLYNYRPDTYNWTPLRYEDPRLFATYTGGTTIDTDASFSGVSLEDLPVTGAITNSYIIQLNITTDMLTGKHTVTIVILSTDGNYRAEITFQDVEFVASAS
ncbi:PL29 family lyase N-terminal domain-containing protein [Bacteroides gallinaceum]|uniref:PL29 family lyase N-terminal domain-containing protein n=1 Tax=Bacteroides gallinaceum TaxID=1462571 RepID=UPI0025A3E2AC|nr:PL29 family lyase N-terminal domain-containing protein [Bacteroides gallinaceum]MDM8154682.1 PL29 family lyase N-terminal domain-containing protein [Bacteroides gallinaceum]